jgi:formamidopyrimidine-DNA glycosylase
MPELPEIQAHAERLDEDFRGATLRRFEPLSFSVLKTFAPDPSTAKGTPVTRVHRRGKYVLIELAPLTFVVHLMQGGRVRPDEKQTKKPRGGVARWVFDDGRALLLTEPGTERKAGVWVVDGDPTTQAPLDGLGPDADVITRDELAVALAANSGRVHGFLRDQHPMAGVGRRLSNEVLHRAQLSPFANTAKLTDDEVDRLHAALEALIAESLEFERAQDEMVKSAERPGAVHNRIGEECPVCGDTVRSVEYRAYTVAYCPTCQTGGKVLADNTTSKFLK